MVDHCCFRDYVELTTAEHITLRGVPDTAHRYRMIRITYSRFVTEQPTYTSMSVFYDIAALILSAVCHKHTFVLCL